MTDRISLTAAELAFLLSVSGTTGSPAPGSARLHRRRPHRAGDRRRAGVAAAAPPGRARAPASRSSWRRNWSRSPRGWPGRGSACRSGCVADRTADGALLFESGIVRFLLAPRAYRCFDVTGVDPAVDRRDPLLQLARPFLDAHRPAVASFTAHSAQVQNAWVTVSAGADGRWSFVPGSEPDAARSGLTADEAMERRAQRTGLAAAGAVTRRAHENKNRPGPGSGAVLHDRPTWRSPRGEWRDAAPAERYSANAFFS